MRFMNEDLGPEIELVIAGHEDVDADRVPQIDHVGALILRRQQRRRERIACVDHEEMGCARSLLLNERGGAREAAAAPLLVHLVDVGGEQEGDPDMTRLLGQHELRHGKNG